MQLKYAGPKALVSHTGVSFDAKKKDKYRYLQCAVHLLKALDHDYLEGQSYAFEPRGDLYSDEELHRTVLHYCPEADSEAKRHYERKAEALDREIAEAARHRLLNDEERMVLEKNLRLMRDYRLQRTVNKSLYYSAVHALAVMIVHKRIRFIRTPFGRNCYHVFHTVEGVARQLKLPLSARIDVYQDKETLMMQLDCLGW